MTLETNDVVELRAKLGLSYQSGLVFVWGSVQDWSSSQSTLTSNVRILILALRNTFTSVLVLVVARSKYWDGLEATGYPFEMKVAEELKKANWDFLMEYPVSVLPDAANLRVEETAIDFKAWWQDSLFALIEARRAAFCEWFLFRKDDGRGFFVLSHHEDSQRRPGFQFHLRQSASRKGRSWSHSQSIVRFQTDRGIYFSVISVNSRGESKDDGEDQQASRNTEHYALHQP